MRLTACAHGRVGSAPAHSHLERPERIGRAHEGDESVLLDGPGSRVEAERGAAEPDAPVRHERRPGLAARVSEDERHHVTDGEGGVPQREEGVDAREDEDEDGEESPAAESWMQVVSSRLTRRQGEEGEKDALDTSMSGSSVLGTHAATSAKGDCSPPTSTANASIGDSSLASRTSLDLCACLSSSRSAFSTSCLSSRDDVSLVESGRLLSGATSAAGPSPSSDAPEALVAGDMGGGRSGGRGEEERR